MLRMQIQPIHRLLGSQKHGQLQLCVPPVVTQGDSYRLAQATSGKGVTALS